MIVAAVGLLALVALAAEQAPFDVDDDTGGIHVPSWGSVFVLGLVVLLIALWIILFVSAQRASGPLARVPRQRGLLNMVATVLVLIALLALLKALRQHHEPETQPVAPPDTEADAKPSPEVSHTGRPWAALTLGGAVLVVLGAAAMTRRRMVDVDDSDEPTERAEVVASLSSSLGALSEPGDDRAAIVAAYADLARRPGPGGPPPPRGRSAGGVRATRPQRVVGASRATERAHGALRGGPLQRARARPCASCASDLGPGSSASRDHGARMIRRLVIAMVVSIVAAATLIASVPTKRTATIRLELWVLAVLGAILFLHLTRERLPLTADPIARAAKAEPMPTEPFAVDSLAIAFTLAPSQQERIRRSAHIQLRDALEDAGAPASVRAELPETLEEWSSLLDDLEAS